MVNLNRGTLEVGGVVLGIEDRSASGLKNQNPVEEGRPLEAAMNRDPPGC